MARGLRGSARAKKEEAAPKRKPAGEDRTGIPTSDSDFNQLRPVVQPANGINVEPEQKPSKIAEKTTAEAPPIHSEEDEEWNFTFEIVPSIGESHNVVVTRIEDGLQYEKRFDGEDSREDAKKWVNEREAQLAAVKAKRKQQKAEDAAVVAPIVTPNAVLDLIPNQLVPFKEVDCVKSVFNPGYWEGRPEAPNFPGELVYKVRDDKSTLHIIPEFETLVRDFMGDEQVQSFRSAEEGLIIVTFPSARKAKFWMAGTKAVMSRI